MSIANETVTLREHAETPDVRLSPQQARAINAFKFNMSEEALGGGSVHRSRVIGVSPGSSQGLYTLNAGSVIGSVSIAGKQISIHPKVGVGKTGQMLAYSLGLARFQDGIASFADSNSLPALLVPAFLAQADAVVREGLVEDYVSCAETGVRPRGRIDFQSVARKGLPSPIDYVFDDFILDTAANRLLVRTLHAISDMHQVPRALHAEARALLGAFGDIPFVEHPTRYHGLPLPSRLSHYRGAMTLGTLILEGSGIEPTASSRLARGLLFDMNKVVEDFLTSLIQRSVSTESFVDVQGRDRPTYLDQQQRFRLRPDFAIWDQTGCRVVGDIKYKVLDREHGPRRSDLYQMVSYAAASGAERAILLYVGRHPGTDILVGSPDLNIEVRAVDIEQDIASIEEQVQTFISSD